MKKTLWILAASSLLFACGCNKTTSGGVAQSAPQAVESSAPGMSAEWTAKINQLNVNSHVNSLLNFIPSDVPAAFISTREYDLSDPDLKSLFARSQKLYESSLSAIVKEIDDAEVEYRIRHVFDRELRPLFEDYENTAPLWGMDPLGRTDYIMYLTDEFFAAKSSILDSTTWKKKIESALRGIEKDFDVEGEVFQIETVNIRGVAWTRYGVVDEEVGVFVHYDKDVVTIAIPLSDKTSLDAINAALVPAANSIDESVFGSLDDRPAMLGIVNTKSLLNLTMKTLRHDYTDSASAACRAEAAALASIFPKTIVRVHIEDEKTMAFDITTALSSQKTLMAIQELTSTVMDFSDDKLFGSLDFSFDVGKSITFFADIATRINQKPFQCDSFSGLNDFAELMAFVPELLASSELGEYASIIEYIKALTSFSAYVWDPVMDENGDLKSVAFAANLLGRAPSGVLVQVIDEESLAGLTFEKGKVETLDLSEEFDFLHLIRSLVTDAGLIWTSGEGIDIEVLSRTEPKKTDNFIRFTLDYGALSQLNPELLRADIKYEASFGVNDKGLRLRFVTKY